MHLYIRNVVLKSRSERTYSFHRADLQQVFLANLESPTALHLGKRLVSYAQSKETEVIEVIFQDGTSTTCDILVGCDGIRSSTRSAMYSQLADIASAAGNDTEAAELRSYIPPKFSGAVVYRCLLKKEDLPEEVAKHPALNKHSMMVVSACD